MHRSLGVEHAARIRSISSVDKLFLTFLSSLVGLIRLAGFEVMYSSVSSQAKNAFMIDFSSSTVELLIRFVSTMKDKYSRISAVVIAAVNLLI